MAKTVEEQEEGGSRRRRQGASFYQSVGIDSSGHSSNGGKVKSSTSMQDRMDEVIISTGENYI